MSQDSSATQFCDEEEDSSSGLGDKLLIATLKKQVKSLQEENSSLKAENQRLMTYSLMVVKIKSLENEVVSLKKEKADDKALYASKMRKCIRKHYAERSAARYFAKDRIRCHQLYLRQLKLSKIWKTRAINERSARYKLKKSIDDTGNPHVDENAVIEVEFIPPDNAQNPDPLENVERCECGRSKFKKSNGSKRAEFKKNKELHENDENYCGTCYRIKLM